MSINAARKEMKDYGVSDPDINCRRSGRTTACCLDIISRAMKTPNTAIPLYDHYSNGEKTLRLITIPTIDYLLSRMDLTDFIIDRKELTLTFNLTPWHKL